jgi:8-oxo-dGTP pyrophosphatase MutT (NUDIX family)
LSGDTARAASRCSSSIGRATATGASRRARRIEAESDEEAAVREVEEEVGLRLVLGPELESTRYRDSKGRKKIVRYWAMELPYGGKEPFAGDGVDEVRWVDFDEAGRHLTWERDLVVLDSLPVEQLV